MKIGDELAKLKAKYGDAVTVTAIDDENLLTVIKDEVDFQFGFLIEKPLLFWYMGDDRHALSYVEQKLNEGSFHTVQVEVQILPILTIVKVDLFNTGRDECGRVDRVQ